MSMSGPQQKCLECGAVEIVRPNGRGFPPDIARRRLAKRYKAQGHTCRPQYTAGIITEPRLAELKANRPTATRDPAELDRRVRQMRRQIELFLEDGERAHLIVALAVGDE